MKKLDPKECGAFPVWENNGFLITQTDDLRFIVSRNGQFVKICASIDEAECLTKLLSKGRRT